MSVVGVRMARFRAMWATTERLRSELTARAERLPESVRHERVADEWSFVECLGVLIEEECEHYRFATCDLTILESR
jgi:hypothetical protein